MISVIHVCDLTLCVLCGECNILIVCWQSIIQSVLEWPRTILFQVSSHISRLNHILRSCNCLYTPVRLNNFLVCLLYMQTIQDWVHVSFVKLAICGPRERENSLILLSFFFFGAIMSVSPSKHDRFLSFHIILSMLAKKSSALLSHFWLSGSNVERSFYIYTCW